MPPVKRAIPASIARGVDGTTTSPSACVRGRTIWQVQVRGFAHNFWCCECTDELVLAAWPSTPDVLNESCKARSCLVKPEPQAARFAALTRGRHSGSCVPYTGSRNVFEMGGHRRTPEPVGTALSALHCNCDGNFEARIGRSDSLTAQSQFFATETAFAGRSPAWHVQFQGGNS